MNRHVDRDLLAYVHGEVDAAQADQIERHLAVCNSCRAELESVRRTHKSLQVLGSEGAPEMLWSRIAVGLETPSRAFQPRRRWLPLALAGLAAGCALAVWFWAPGKTQVNVVGGLSVAVSADKGAPRVDGSPVASGSAKLYVGQELVTGPGESATIDMKDVGIVKVLPETRVGLLQCTDKHRLDLKSGTISAKISAPPKIFFVETPLATAVDLGCEYTLTVNEHGEGKLSVISGWVELQSRSGTALVPADAECAIYPKEGVGVPYFKGADAACVSWLSRFEQGDRTVLPELLRSASKADALTVWHLLYRVEGADRELVYDRLAVLAPPPKGVSRARVLALDEKTLLLWREAIAPMKSGIFW